MKVAWEGSNTTWKAVKPVKFPQIGNENFTGLM